RISISVPSWLSKFIVGIVTKIPMEKIGPGAGIGDKNHRVYHGYPAFGQIEACNRGRVNINRFVEGGTICTSEFRFYLQANREGPFVIKARSQIIAMVRELEHT